MKKYISVLFVLPFLAACQKNIKVKLPDHEEQLFFFSNAETGSNFSAYVRRSEKITQYNNLHDLSVKNATVMLYINEGAGTPVYYVDSLERYMSPVIINANDKLRIEVIATGYPQAEATAIVPLAVPIEEVTAALSTKKDQYGNPASELKIKFTDPPTQGDYYIIELVQPEGGTDNWFCVQSNDQSIDKITGNDPILDGQDDCLPSNGILLNDILFNGKTKELVLYAVHYFFEPWEDSLGTRSYPQVRLKHITPEYYKYLKTTKNVLDNSGNPFAEPVNVISNIKNGYGALAPISVSVREIKL